MKPRGSEAVRGRRQQAQEGRQGGFQRLGLSESCLPVGFSPSAREPSLRVRLGSSPHAGSPEREPWTMGVLSDNLVYTFFVCLGSKRRSELGLWFPSCCLLHWSKNS